MNPVSSSVNHRELRLSSVNRHAKLGVMEEKEVISVYVPDDGAQTFHLGSVMIDLPGLLTVENQPAVGQSVSFRVDWIDGTGVRPVAITVSSLSGEEITSTDLRAVQAKSLWRAAIIEHVTYQRLFLFEWDEDPWKIARESHVQLPPHVIDQMRLRGPVRSTLEYVTDLYEFADTIGLPPAQFVQDMFAEGTDPLPRTTATKWIKKAKDMGLFEEWSNGDD